MYQGADSSNNLYHGEVITCFLKELNMCILVINSTHVTSLIVGTKIIWLTLILCSTRPDNLF